MSVTETGKKQLRTVTIIYWTLLFYIIAALIWWFISLETQNRQNTELAYHNLELQSKTISPQERQMRYDQIGNISGRNHDKYLLEGVTFLILIMIGAVFVYRTIRSQFRHQQQQQNFMMAVTHELKTPISVARLNLETLQKYNLDPEKQKKLLKMTLDETGRLNFLTNNILIASQLEGGGYKISKDDLDISDLLHDCIQDFRERFPDRVIIEEIQPDADVKGDALLLQMLINNLLENAIKYSSRESPITAVLKKFPGKTQLEIKDIGIGIPPEERKKIFTRFYRIGNEATRKTQGTGLGLYLCSKIARDHNADILVTNNIPTGSNFTVNFYS